MAGWPVASGSLVTCSGMKPLPRLPQSGSTKVSGALGTNWAADEPTAVGLVPKSWRTSWLPRVAAKKTAGVAGPSL